MLQHDLKQIYVSSSFLFLSLHLSLFCLFVLSVRSSYSVSFAIVFLLSFQLWISQLLFVRRCS